MAREAKFNFTSEDHILKAPRHGGAEYKVAIVVSKIKEKNGGGSGQVRAPALLL